MQKLYIAVVVTAMLSGCGTKDREAIEPEQPKIAPQTSQQSSLPVRILGREILLKGGSLNPPIAPKYKMWVAKAALTEPTSIITKESVTATLAELLRSIRSEADQAGDIYAITAFLYQSPDHANGANEALGRAEWWPKGHSFDTSNSSNIENRVSHEEEIKVFSLPATTPVGSGNSRLPEETRKEVFKALVKSQDRASQEADALFPINGNNMPIGKLASYDLKEAAVKNSDEASKRRTRYEKELLKRYEITKPELQAINEEAFAKNWPLPPTR
jgi:hypothetical protein